MTQTTSRLFDELAKLMTDAAGAAKGVRTEVETMMRTQAEKILRELDVVSREEFEAVKAMARKAREENDALARRLDALEGKPAAPKRKPAAPKRNTATAAKAKPAAARRKTTTSARRKSPPKRNAAPA